MCLSHVHDECVASMHRVIFVCLRDTVSPSSNLDHWNKGKSYRYCTVLGWMDE